MDYRGDDTLMMFLYFVVGALIWEHFRSMHLAIPVDAGRIVFIPIIASYIYYLIYPSFITE